MVADNDLGVPEAALHPQAPKTRLKAELLNRKDTFRVAEEGKDGYVWFVAVMLNRIERGDPHTEVTIEAFPDCYHKFEKPFDWDPTTEELRELAENAVEKARSNPD